MFNAFITIRRGKLLFSIAYLSIPKGVPTSVASIQSDHNLMQFKTLRLSNHGMVSDRRDLASINTKITHGRQKQSADNLGKPHIFSLYRCNIIVNYTEEMRLILLFSQQPLHY